MKKLIEKMKSLVRDEEGATMVEYGIMVAFIAAVSILLVWFIGDWTGKAFQSTADAMGQKGPPPPLQPPAAP